MLAQHGALAAARGDFRNQMGSGHDHRREQLLPHATASEMVPYSSGDLSQTTPSSNHVKRPKMTWSAISKKSKKVSGGGGGDDDGRKHSTGMLIKGKFLVLDPRSQTMLTWMLVIFFAAVATAIATPVELAWFEAQEGEWAANTFFLVFNSIIIAIFFLDIIINFNMAYFDDDDGVLVTSRRKISLNYLKFWFFMDLLATFPFDAFVAAVSGGDSSVGQVLRLLKLFRLLRIMKVLGSKRVLRIIEADHAVKYDTISLVGFALTLLGLMHLMACGLFFVGIMNDPYGGDDDDLYSYAWEITYSAFEVKNHIAGDDIFSQWLFCMYWAAMTVSTIGYGDVVLPNNAVRFYAIICMLVGASAYAYMVGALIQVILNMNRKEQERRTLLSDVNEMTKTVGLPVEKQQAIRQFFSKTNGGESTLDNYLAYLDRLSPPLAGTVINHIMHDWLPKVWWLQPAMTDDGFLLGLMRLLREQSFAEGETVIRSANAANTLFVVKSGSIELSGNGRLFAEGMGVGEEILQQQRRTYGYSVTAVTYLDTWRLERDSFRDFVHGYPTIRARILWTCVQLAVQLYGGMRQLSVHIRKRLDSESSYDASVANGGGGGGGGGGSAGAYTGNLYTPRSTRSLSANRVHSNSLEKIHEAAGGGEENPSAPGHGSFRPQMQAPPDVAGGGGYRRAYGGGDGDDNGGTFGSFEDASNNGGSGGSGGGGGTIAAGGYSGSPHAVQQRLTRVEQKLDQLLQRLPNE